MRVAASLTRRMMNVAEEACSWSRSSPLSFVLTLRRPLRGGGSAGLNMLKSQHVVVDLVLPFQFRETPEGGQHLAGAPPPVARPGGRPVVSTCCVRPGSAPRGTDSAAATHTGQRTKAGRLPGRSRAFAVTAESSVRSDRIVRGSKTCTRRQTAVCGACMRNHRG